MRLKLLLLCVLVLDWSISFGQDSFNSGIVYGKKHAYMLTAPKGWVLDNQSGVSQGLHAVFYPQGSSWDSETVMYTNTALTETSGTISEVIKYDINTYKQESPGLTVIQKDAIVIDKKKKARVYYFYGDKTGNYEAVAYIPEKDVTVFIVLTSRSERGFNDNLNIFKELIKSYNFLTDKIIIGK